MFYHITPRELDELEQLIHIMMAPKLEDNKESNLLDSLLLKHGAKYKLGTPDIIELPKANGSLMMAAKAELVAVPDSSGSGRTKALMRVSYRPEVCLPEPAYSHKFYFTKEFDPTLKTSIRSTLEIAALHALAMPKIRENVGDLDSFREYNQSFDTFEKDVLTLLAIEPTLLQQALAANKQELPLENINVRMLELGLGLDGTSRWSVAGAIKIVNDFIATKGATTMDKMSVKDRLLKGAKEGAARGLIGETNRQTVSLIIAQMGDKAPDWLKTEIGHKALEGLIAAGLVFALSTPQAGQLLPPKVVAGATAAAEMAWNDFSATSMTEVMKTALEVLLPVINQYAQAGEMLSGAEPAGLSMEEVMSVQPGRQVEHAGAYSGPKNL